MNDTVIKGIAAAAAAAIVLAPYLKHLKALGLALLALAKAAQADIARVCIAAVILAGAWGKIPIPTPSYSVPKVVVQTPSTAMQTAVAPIKGAISAFSAADRATWAALWVKMADAVGTETSGPSASLTSSMTLRTYIIVALDIGWNRIGHHQPGQYPQLRQAIESVCAANLGMDAAGLDATARSKAAELFNAIAWAGQ